MSVRGDKDVLEEHRLHFLGFRPIGGYSPEASELRLKYTLCGMARGSCSAVSISFLF